MPDDATNAVCDKCGGRVAIHTMAMCGVCKQLLCETCLGDHFEPEKVAASLTNAKLTEQAK